MMSPHSRAASLLLTTVVMLTAGCIDSAPPESLGQERGLSSSGEESWETQVALVRSGERRTIRFTDDPITRDQWAMLAEGCAGLTVLEVDDRALTTGDLDVLAELTGLRRVKLLGPIDDAGLQKVCAIGNLTSINLPNGEFTDEGFAALASLPDLELLRFGSPHVTDECLAVVSGMPTLRFLHLIGVPVSDVGLQHLHGMRHLESFYLDGGRCTDAGLRDLLQALPELHFHRDQLHLPDDPLAHPHD